MSEKRDVPARFLLPQATQDILDRAFARLFTSLDISEDRLNSTDPKVIKALDRELYPEAVLGQDTGPRMGDVDFEGNDYMPTQTLVGSTLLRAAGIRTSFELGATPETSYSAHIQYPFKTIHLDQKLQEPPYASRWFVQLTPDSPPLMMHYDDIHFARMHSTERMLRDVPQTARLVREAFGDEAVKVLDDQQSAEVIGLLTAAEPYARVADYADDFDSYRFDT